MITKLPVISYKVKHPLTSFLNCFCLQGCSSEDDCPELVVTDDVEQVGAVDGFKG